MIIGFLFHIIANALAIIAAGRLVSNVVFDYNFLSLVKIALLLALANAFIKPVLKIVFSPLILVTLGLFTLAINLFLIWLVTRFTPELAITGLGAYFWTMIIISAFNFVVSVTYNRHE